MKVFTPVECCIVNAFIIRRTESISPLDLIKVSIREAIFCLPVQQTHKALCPRQFLHLYSYAKISVDFYFLSQAFTEMYSLQWSKSMTDDWNTLNKRIRPERHVAFGVSVWRDIWTGMDEGHLSLVLCFMHKTNRWVIKHTTQNRLIDCP